MSDRTDAGSETYDPFASARRELGDPFHVRDYRVEVFRLGPAKFRMVGTVRDTRIGGLTAEDPDPLDVHHMGIVLDVSLPGLVIEHAEPAMSVHPNASCPEILDAYGQLVGLSLMRGFTKALRERVGGPGGCSHLTNLVQAMAPVAWQALFGFSDVVRFPLAHTDEARRLNEISYQWNRNTCHVFGPEGEVLQWLETGEFQPPLWASRRAERLGVRLQGEPSEDPEDARR